MNILYLLIPLALLIAGGAVLAFSWSVRSGQFDDLDTPPMRVITEDRNEQGPASTTERRPATIDVDQLATPRHRGRA